MEGFSSGKDAEDGGAREMPLAQGSSRDGATKRSDDVGWRVAEERTVRSHTMGVLASEFIRAPSDPGERA